jgi:subtilisin family serine protease
MFSMSCVGRTIGLTALLGVAALSSAQSPQAEFIMRRSSAALEQNPWLPYNPFTILVKFKPGANTQEANDAIGGIVLAEPGIVPGLQIIGTSLDPRAAVSLMSQRSDVEYAELDYTVRANVIPNDPSFNVLWGMHNTGQSGGVVDADIDAPEAWDIHSGSNTVVVAIIDTGFLRTHPDLAANSWVNPGEIANNGIDDDANGRVDDLYGWDFVNNDNNPTDDNSHGTHCAGTIGGVGNNGIGVAGVSWNVKMFGLKFLGSNGSGSTSNAILAVDYCRIKGIKISNNSWGGGGFSQSMFNAIQNAGNMGHIFVAAAGNSNRNNDTTANYPSNYNLPNIIAVASTTRTDARSSFSNWGKTTVDLGAPGSDIYSTVLSNGYGYKSGTSMATPHVAGAVALLWGFKPNWTKEQVIQGVLSTVRPTSAMNNITVTGGVLNVYNMLVAAQGNTGPSVTISSPANGGNANQGATVTFTGTAMDTQDGNITASLVWTSSRDGQIGTGGTFTRNNLSGGVHVITASVTDSGGLTGQNQVTFTINVSVPNAPSNLTKLVGSTSITLNWTDNANNETGFEIIREEYVNFNWVNPTSFTVNANVTQFVDSGLSGTFRYRVRAFNSAGNSGFTNYQRARF